MKVLIDDLKNSKGASAKEELDRLKAQDATIKKIEKKIKDSRSALKDKTSELEFKSQLKRLGGDGFKAESQELIQQVESRLAKLDPGNNIDKKKITDLNKDKAALEERIAKTNTVLKIINGQLTDDETKHLILKKLYDVAKIELEHYLNAEKRQLIAGVENLWSKYAVSSQQMENDRETLLGHLNEFLGGLGYLG